MSGQPAARISDRVSYGVIVTGSRTVLIGSQGGVACSVCPGGVKVSNPVNPQLGAKVLVGDGELDFALPGALPVAWQRQYSSYVNAEHGARCGLLGWGWHLPSEMTLQLGDDACRLFDTGGRVITFEPLSAGQSIYSPSEDIWLARGGPDAAWQGEWRWRHIPANLAANPDCVLATSGAGATTWLFAAAPWPAGVATSAEEPALSENTHETPPPQPARRYRLQAQLDRFGRSQRYVYAEQPMGGPALDPQAGPQGDEVPEGTLLALTDGVGRHYRLRYVRVHGGKPAQGLWGADDGWRLAAVELDVDPVGTGTLPLTLVRYAYDREGHLVSVHDRAGELVREFAWQHHRIVAHRHRGGPRHTYRYASAEPGARVIEHGNEQGLSYRFDYVAQSLSAEGQPRRLTRVSDSLGRVETYHFEGEAGLERLVLHERADGSQLRHEYDGAGRLVATTDPLGRTTRLLLDAQGRLLSAQGPDRRRARRQLDPATGQLLQSQDATGAITRYRYDDHGRLLETTWADGSTERYRYPDPREQPLTCDAPVAIEDAQGGIKHLAWNDAGLLASYTDCSGHSTHYQYDRFGQLAEVTDALGQRQRIEHDAAGRIVATIHPDGSREHYRHDGAGQIVRIELHGPSGAHNPQGHPAEDPPAASAIDLSYDLWGRLTRRSHGGLTLQFEYDIAGRLTRLLNENGAQSRFAWDAMDRLVQEEGFDQRLQRYQWDAAGQLLEASDGNARSQRSSHYRWGHSGELIELTLPGHGSADLPAGHITRQRFEWDAAGRLLAAHAHGPGNRLLSQALIERDALGRITAEVQRLYRLDASASAEHNPAAEPEVEFEHRIAHQLDALGHRQGSQLQALGQLHWQRYGSGHVHGLLHEGQSLIDFERDRLHRETQRTLHGQPTPVHITRQWDALGRLRQLTTQGLHGQGGLAPVLIGQISQRQYHYDALGQLTALQTAGHSLRYAYDAAGRLRALQQGEHTRHWHLDAAGNRLPQPLPPGQAPAQDWAAQVHAHWQQAHFNLLGQGQGATPASGPVTRWPDNRIGYSDQAAWRYDEFGNRIEQLSFEGQPDGQGEHQAQHLVYDGAHRLTRITQPGRSSSYRYDALGRRLSRHTQGAEGEGASQTYYGWDGDRLIHTEQIESQAPEQRRITHTVYEPDSFTPLVQLSTVKAAGATKPAVLGLMLQEAQEPEEAPMAQMLGALPKDMQQALEQSLRHAMEGGIPSAMRTLMGEDQSQNALQRLTGLHEQLEKQEQEQKTPITVRHYHCDHLGTPLALTDSQGQIVWAARLDPWGNVEEEFNPHQIAQSIRLPGQHHDRDTGLYYNRHRYYDPTIGSYVNQDPIGLSGGPNPAIYPINPHLYADPLGLFSIYGYKQPQTGQVTYSFDFKNTNNASLESAMGRIPGVGKYIKRGREIQERVDNARSAGAHDTKKPKEASACDPLFKKSFEDAGYKAGGPATGSQLSREEAESVLWMFKRESRPDVNIIPGGAACLSHYDLGTILDTASQRAIDPKGTFGGLAR